MPRAFGGIRQWIEMRPLSATTTSLYERRVNLAANCFRGTTVYSRFDPLCPTQSSVMTELNVPSHNDGMRDSDSIRAEDDVDRSGAPSPSDVREDSYYAVDRDWHPSLIASEEEYQSELGSADEDMGSPSPPDIGEEDSPEANVPHYYVGERYWHRSLVASEEGYQSDVESADEDTDEEGGSGQAPRKRAGMKDVDAVDQTMADAAAAQHEIIDVDAEVQVSVGTATGKQHEIIDVDAEEEVTAAIASGKQREAIEVDAKAEALAARNRKDRESL